MKIKILDIFVIIIALAISSVLIFKPVRQTSEKQFEIMNGSEIIVIPSSDKDYDFKNDFLDIQGKRRNIQRDIHMDIKDGIVNVLQSSCQDKICVNMASAKNCGDIIICLPNQFAVLINCDKTR